MAPPPDRRGRILDTTTAPDASTPATLPPPLDVGPAPISGFWRRLGAFVIDAFVLGAVGMLIGLVFSDALLKMGGWERLIGIAIVLAYAGVLNSRIGGGRTLGKRLLGIRVIGLDGTLLSLPRTLARQVVFATPFFLNGLPVDAGTLMGFSGVLLSFVLFGGMLSIIYLAIFNRGSRRSLHDLAVGSYVVRDSSDVAAPAPPTWRGHFVVVAILFALAAAVPFAGERLAQTSFFAGMLPLQAALADEPGVQAANVAVGRTLGDQGSTYVQVTLKIDNRQIEDYAQARGIARQVLALYPAAAEKDVIHVTLYYGFDMVIASTVRSHAYRFDPRELAADTEKNLSDP